MPTAPLSFARRRYGAAALGALGLAALPTPASPAIATALGGPDKYALLHSFGDPGVAEDGIGPMAALLAASDGHLYGTTQQGGIGDGTIFKVKLDAGRRVQVRTVHTFDRTVEGGLPSSVLIEGPDGGIYGTTPDVGTGPCPNGSIFRLDPEGGLQTLYAFGTTHFPPSNPRGGLVLASDGNYYGTTSNGGGLAGSGTVFMMTPGGVVTTLYVLRETVTPAIGPMGELIQASDGALYGITEGSSSADEFGTVYSISLAGEFKLLHKFAGPDGAFPWAGLVQASDGLLYGSAIGRGHARHDGTVYRMALDGSDFSFITMRSRSPIGHTPMTNLTQASNGALYGTTSVGGPQGGGCVYRLEGDRRLRVHAFLEAGRDFGVSPSAVIQAADGALYGTTQYGGVFSHGSVFRIGDLAA